MLLTVTIAKFGQNWQGSQHKSQSRSQVYLSYKYDLLFKM